MQFEIQNSKSGAELPPGAYPARFDEIRPIETAKGKAYRWAFTLDDGRTYSDLSDAETPPTNGNKMGRWLAGLVGSPAVPGLKIDALTCVGRRYVLVIGERSKLSTLTAIPSA